MTVSETPLAIATVETPIGPIRIGAHAEGISQVRFANDETFLPEDRHPGDASRAHLQRGVEALTAYFVDGKKEFSDLTLCPEGTQFQRTVWAALLTIPFGVTCSYRDIAEQIGNPKGVRAVGLANGRNPIPVFIPCHRVIGSNGSLTGFGGGLPAKKWLLEHEGVLSGTLL